MKYLSLKNMTEEEKLQRKRKQKNEAQKRYYQKHKEYYKSFSKRWSKEQFEKKENIINMALNYVEDKGRLKYKPEELKKILKGEMTYKE